MSAWEAWRRLTDFLRGRKIDYCATFTSPAGKRVLADLAPFCRAGTTCWSADQRMSDVLTGRREVWLRIQQHLQLNEDELARLYDGGRQAPIAREEDPNG